MTGPFPFFVVGGTCSLLDWVVWTCDAYTFDVVVGAQPLPPPSRRQVWTVPHLSALRVFVLVAHLLAQPFASLLAASWPSLLKL